MALELPKPLISDDPVIVYLDFKSPYAYLAVEPTRAAERALGVEFDWRPFVLDIPSYLGSARLDKTGKVIEQKRSAEQWGGVKYAYFDCRRYARLNDLTIRGTEKIWDTNLVSCAMWWVRSRDRATVSAFIDAVYAPFWVRELDVESTEVMRSLLDSLDADGASFLAWYHGGGAEQNQVFQDDAFAAGVYGVPSYLVAGEQYFGREHLPRVAWQVASSASSFAPDIAYPAHDQKDLDSTSAMSPESVTVGVDSSLDSLLAVPQIIDLLADFEGEVSWVRVPTKKFYHAPRAGDDSRANQHRELRLLNVENNLARYRPEGLKGDSFGPLIEMSLSRRGIQLLDEGPEALLNPPAPGVQVMLDEEPFIGRQHLPLIAQRLALAD